MQRIYIRAGSSFSELRIVLLESSDLVNKSTIRRYPTESDEIRYLRLNHPSEKRFFFCADSFSVLSKSGTRDTFSD